MLLLNSKKLPTPDRSRAFWARMPLWTVHTPAEGLVLPADRVTPILNGPLLRSGSMAKDTESSYRLPPPLSTSSSLLRPRPNFSRLTLDAQLSLPRVREVRVANQRPNRCARVSVFSCPDPALTVSQKVIILGGGIAGLSAAHELVERSFDVEVYELLPIPGGKARSFPVPGSGTDGRKRSARRTRVPFLSPLLSARHRHDEPDSRTALRRSVADNLVDTTRCQLNRVGRHPVDLIARSPAHDQRRARDRSTTSAASSAAISTCPTTTCVLRLEGLADRHVVPRTADERVRKDRVVGFHRRRAPLARLPEAARPRHHAVAGRGEGAHREHEDDRRHLRPVAVRHRHARTQHRPGAERPDQRRLDRSVAALPGVTRGRLSPGLEGDGGVVRWRSAFASATVARGGVDRDSRAATISSSRCRSRT